MISNTQYRVNDYAKLSKLYFKILELNIDKLSDEYYYIDIENKRCLLKTYTF